MKKLMLLTLQHFIHSKVAIEYGKLVKKALISSFESQTTLEVRALFVTIADMVPHLKERNYRGVSATHGDKAEVNFSNYGWKPAAFEAFSIPVL